jgi:hypothetical protein
MSLPNLSRVIQRFTTGTYTVTRTSAATSYTDGVRSAPATTTTTVVGVVQPIPGKDLERLPEGLRDAEVKYLWSTTELKCGPDLEPDRVSVEGSTWQVEQVRKWDTLGSYWRSVIRKV